jgi:7,8-dihydropterin-6-yl-methyl-4-(beta-D-ribofuranosyl)aminobenzene 5'-phosphate synthase
MSARQKLYHHILFMFLGVLLFSVTAPGKDIMNQKSTIFPQDLKISVVFNNDSFDANLKTGWGFSCVITGLEETILFDTGADGDILLSNMEKLHIRPDTIQTIVLSHHHSDHTGGLDLFLQKNPHVKVVLLKSFPAKIKNLVQSRGALMIEVSEPLQICQDTYSTGEIVAHINEQALVIRSDKGLIIITGCAHPDIVSMVEKAKALFADDILLVMGGWHLGNRNEQELHDYVSQFRGMHVQFTAPTHCSGELTRRIFAREYNDRYIDAGVGQVIKYADFPVRIEDR